MVRPASECGLHQDTKGRRFGSYASTLANIQTRDEENSCCKPKFMYDTELWQWRVLAWNDECRGGISELYGLANARPNYGWPWQYMARTSSTLRTFELTALLIPAA